MNIYFPFEGKARELAARVFFCTEAAQRDHKAYFGHKTDLYPIIPQLKPGIFFHKSFKTGTCACFFLIAYGFFRIFSEIFREPDIQLGYFLNIFSMGMILSFIMILTGLSMFVALKKNEN